MTKQTLGALGLSLLVTQLAGCFIVVDDGPSDGQFAVAWSFSYGGSAQQIGDACSDLGVNKMDIKTVDQANGQVQYFRYDCTAGSVVTDPPLLEGRYLVSVELRFDNDSDPTNGPLPLFGPVSPGNNSVCTGGSCQIFGGEVSSVGQFVFDVPTTTVTFHPIFDTNPASLTDNCVGPLSTHANISSQIVSFSSGGQSIIAPIAGLIGGTAQSSFTGQSNSCQPRSTTLAITAVLFPATYDLDLIGRDSGAHVCYEGGTTFDVVDLTGGVSAIDPVVSIFNNNAACTFPKR